MPSTTPKFVRIIGKSLFRTFSIAMGSFIAAFVILICLSIVLAQQSAPRPSASAVTPPERPLESKTPLGSQSEDPQNLSAPYNPYPLENTMQKMRATSDGLFEKLPIQIQNYLYQHPETGFITATYDPIEEKDRSLYVVRTVNTDFEFTIKNEYLIRAHVTRQTPIEFEYEEPDLPADGKPTLDHFDLISIGDSPADVQDVMGTKGSIVKEESDLRVAEWKRGRAWMLIQYEPDSTGKWKVVRKTQDGLKPYQPPRLPGRLGFR
jgi:hypothetical protein